MSYFRTLSYNSYNIASYTAQAGRGWNNFGAVSFNVIGPNN